MIKLKLHSTARERVWLGIYYLCKLCDAMIFFSSLTLLDGNLSLHWLTSDYLDV
jgi:hypothetical protein